jgi:GAF domain-containing protein/HAMP domain-containing protein
VNTPAIAQPIRSMKLRTRVAVSFVALAVIASGLTMTFVFLNFRNQLRESLRQRLENIVSLAALQQDGDAFLNILSADDLEYDRVRLQNLEILHSDPDLVFVYTMRYDDEGVYFVVDAGDPNDPLFSPFGARYESAGPALMENYRTISQAISEQDFYRDEYGYFESAYAPIRTDSGQVVGIIGADMSADKIIAGERRLLLITITIFGALLPFIALAGWMLGRNLAAPIEALTVASEYMAKGEFNFRPPIQSSIPELKSLSQSFFSMSDQLNGLIGELEKRVEARTTELTVASQQIQNRATQLQTISEVAHSVSLVQDIDQLQKSIVNLIAERFGFYHIGIFLLDGNEEFAILSATNSIGGQRMLGRGHKLKVGEVGIVGFVAGSGRPRIALDVGSDAVFFNNPDLPETRSEMALPLLVRERVIGVLDIQSKETAAFSESDFEVFHTLADQVAVAIENARLFNQARRSLDEAERAYGESVQKGWENVRRKGKKSGYRYNQLGTQPISDNFDVLEGSWVSGEDTLPIPSGESSSIAIPLVVRKTPIGVLDIKTSEKRVWSSAEIATLQRIVDRTALALENARLVEDTSLRAERERTVSQITSNIRSNTDQQSMIQTALDELKRVLGVNEIEIRPYKQSSTPADRQAGTPGNEPENK